MTFAKRAVILLLLFCCGCSEFQTDRQEFDSLVEDIWLEDARLLDALEYLSHGGQHFFPETTVDRDYVIPLCEKINATGARCHVLIYEDDTAQFALDILVEVKGAESQIKELIAAADAEFTAGTIDQEWGNKWMAFGFSDEVDR